jgi:diphosphomevalonate decarboxylase
MSPTRVATARAHPNVALVKYWGKRDATLNLPATGSISVTLAGLTTRTVVRWEDGGADELRLNGAPADAGTLAKAAKLLDRLRALAGSTSRARIDSTNDFPTGAGLASSASGFSALAAAGARALGLELDTRTLSALARLGSGSAARSIFGGFVEMKPGTMADGSDAVAEPLLAAEAWPLSVLVAVTSSKQKSVQSTAGMESTRASSPFWAGWVGSAEADLAELRAALLRRDFAAVGELTEYSCLKMHGLALSARPGLVYWNGTTVTLVHAVRALRQGGTAAYFTIDAGPQVKVLCQAADAATVRTALAAVPGVERLIDSGPGGPVEVASGES